LKFVNDCLETDETKYFLDSTKTKLEIYYKYKDNVNDNCGGPLADSSRRSSHGRR